MNENKILEKIANERSHIDILKGLTRHNKGFIKLRYRIELIRSRRRLKRFSKQHIAKVRKRFSRTRPR